MQGSENWLGEFVISWVKEPFHNCAEIRAQFYRERSTSHGFHSERLGNIRNSLKGEPVRSILTGTLVKLVLEEESK